MNWSETKFSQFLETASKIMACAALFSIVLPTAAPNIFMALFLFCSIIAGNYRFKFNLIFNNSIALISSLLFLLFIIGLVYTSASDNEALVVFKKYSKFFYIPFLLLAFHEEQWKKFGYIAFLSGVTLMMLMSYLTFTGWSPESLYSGTYAGRDAHIIFRSRIAHGLLVAFAAYLYLVHAIDFKNKYLRILLIVLAILASVNILTMVASRSAQLLWIILIVLLVYLRFGWKRALLGSLLVPILAFSILYSSETTRIRLFEILDDIQLLEQQDYGSSVGVRVIWAKAGLEIIKNNSITGTGTGSFKEEFNKIIESKNIPDEKFYSTIYNSMNPHNEYLSIGVQLGLIGLLLYLLLLIQQWRLSYRMPLNMNHIAKGFVVTVAVSGIFNSVIYAHTQGVFFALFTALMFASNKSEVVSS